MRVATWNLERKNPLSGLGASAVDHLGSLAPDLMVLTESRTNFPPAGGHLLWATPPAGTWFNPDERKVMLWSKQPWSPAMLPLAGDLDQTRFVAGITESPIGQVMVLGLCIPWHMAEVTHRVGRKRKPWELHIDYLDVLAGLLRSIDGPLIVSGDFNQQVPRVRYGNRAAAAALERAFEPLTILTAGTLSGCERPGIDHIAVSDDLTAVSVAGWPSVIGGQRMSDHDGAVVEVARPG